MTEPEPTSQGARVDPWWRSAVVYQVYLRSFADSNGDGVGDLRGVIEHLDHIANLGADVIWLSPVQPSPGHDNGYDISDYEAIDPVFGSFDDFDDLITEVHRRGMRLIMDLVVNHTSDQHPWFLESALGPQSPKRDWYWWRPPRDGMRAGEPQAEPTNWGSWFSGSAWELDTRSGEYYLHLFSRKQPDLNWENPDLRHAIYRMMRWWLDRGIDGFRMDVINLVSKDPALPDGVTELGNGYGDGSPHYNCGPRVHEFLHEMRNEVFVGREGTYLTLGEMPGVTIDQARMFTDPCRGELDMVFQFDHVGLDHGIQGKWFPREVSVVELKRSLADWQTGLGMVGWNSLYWNNHDQPRVVSRFGNDTQFNYESATALATVLYMQRGTPFLYQGEELGMTNARFDTLDQYRDIETLSFITEAVEVLGIDEDNALGRVQAVSRDNSRTPMQWTDDANAGFTDGVPWIPVNSNYTIINAAAQRNRPCTVFDYYRRLLALRKTQPAAIKGEFKLLLEDHPSLFVYTRCLDQTWLLVAANLSNKQVDLDDEEPWRSWWREKMVLANYPQQPTRNLQHLQPWETFVLKR